MFKNKPFILLGSLLLSAILVIASMILFVGPLFEAKKLPVGCSKPAIQHTATILNNKINPEQTNAKKCDTLTIINNDTVTRLIAFGEHEHHTSYDGVAEQRLSQGQSFTVKLNQTGSFIMHDHYDESVTANFTVTD